MHFHKLAYSFVILFAMVLTGCGQQGNNLSGHWKTDGYQCPWGTFHTETIVIEHTTEQVIAHKVIGDECVPTGEVTFKGVYNDYENSFECVTGTPDNPASGTVPSRLKIVDSKKIKICDKTFVRL